MPHNLNFLFAIFQASQVGECSTAIWWSIPILNRFRAISTRKSAGKCSPDLMPSIRIWTTACASCPTTMTMVDFLLLFCGKRVTWIGS